MIILPNTSILELKRMRIRWDKWFKDWFKALQQTNPTQSIQDGK
jgi:hypothetical protein